MIVDPTEKGGIVSGFLYTKKSKKTHITIGFNSFFLVKVSVVREFALLTFKNSGLSLETF